MQKDHGFVVWVLGPAAVFDSDSRNALISLIDFTCFAANHQQATVNASGSAGLCYLSDAFSG